jgi:hypothetical protein
MIAIICALAAVVALLVVALIFARVATQRATDRALAEVAKSVDASIREETDKRRSEAANKAQAYEATIPQKSDAELQAEINK